MKKFFMAAIATTLLLSSAVYADVDTFDIISQNGSYVISGTVEREPQAKNIAVEVLKQGIEFSNSVDFADVYYLKQQDFLAGEYEFSFSFPADFTETGIYKVRLDGEGFSDPALSQIEFVKDGDFEIALSGLSGNLSSFSDFDTFISTGNNALCLGFNADVPAGVSKEAVYDIIKDDAAQISSREKGRALWNGGILQQLFTNELVSDIADYSNLIKSIDEDIEKWYDHLEGYSDEALTKLTATIKAQSFSNNDEFLNGIKAALVLSVVKYPDGNSNIGVALTDFSEITNITANNEVAKYNQIAGSDYTNLNTFLSDFAKLKADAGGSGSGGGAGGGGGGAVSGNKDVVDGFIAVGGETQDKKPVKMTFLDLDTVPWAYEAISTLSDMKIINGKSAERFAPDDFITREEFAKLCVVLRSLENKDYKINFTDTKVGEWYTPYVNIAYENGICSGMGDGSFGAGSVITRQDMAVILYNTLKGAGFSGKVEALTFSDSAKVSDYAKDAVSALVNEGAINGVGGNMFDPLGNATRAQAAKMLYGVLDILK